MPVYVKDIMVTPVLTITEERSVQEAAKLMGRKRKGCIIVTRRGKPIGILTDSDIIKRIVAKDIKPSKVKVKEVMSSPLITISPKDDILTAVRKMKRANIHRLPVVSRGKLVGIISLSDIAKTSPELLDLLEERLRMREEEPRIREETTAGICESCGNYSEILRYVNGQWLCETCIEEFE